MKKQVFLIDYINMVDIQADRLSQALYALESILPLTVVKLVSANSQLLAFMDMAMSRFGKLQDIAGAQVFPMVLQKLGEDDAASFIDKLNRLEKLYYLDNANWWLELRIMRNKMAHEYPDHELICAQFNAFIPKAYELLNFWNLFKKKIEPILNN